jgi:hypothetical protein
MTPNTDPDIRTTYKSEYAKFIPDSSNRFTIEEFAIESAKQKSWKALDMTNSLASKEPLVIVLNPDSQIMVCK